MGRRVLVTNDDGIDGPGLRQLTAALVEHGYEPIVIAPNRDYSGAAGSLLSLGVADPSHDQAQLRYERRVLAEAPDVEAIALDGPPALCALMAVREAFGPKPDLVASGINFGLNAGPAVLHSGTVNAALTAARAGIPSLAVSAAFSPDAPDETRYDTAALVAMQVLDKLASSRHAIVSLNVPRCDPSELRGLRSAPLAPSFRWRSFVESIEDGVITRTYRETDEVLPPNTDSSLIERGWATLSSLVGISTVDCSDLVKSVTEAAA
jgi:5'-nucleotidase